MKRITSFGENDSLGACAAGRCGLPTSLVAEDGDAQQHAALVSVVLTVCGAAAEVADTVRSLQRQTHGAWEAFIVLGYEDSTIREVIIRLAEEDHRIRLVEHSAAGGKDVRNAGLAAANGAWVAFLRAGERLLPRSLEMRLEAARARGTQVVHSDGHVLHGTQLHCLGVRPLAGNVLNDLIEDEGPGFSGLLVATDALRKIGGLDATLAASQAWDTMLRLADGYAFAFEPTPTFVCPSTRDASASMQDAARDYERFIRKHLGRFVSEAGAGVVATRYREAAARYNRAGQQIAAARCRVIVRLAAGLARVRQLRGRKRPGTAADAGHAGFRQRTTIDVARTAAALSELLHVEVRNVTTEFQAGQSGSVHRVEFSDGTNARRQVVLKRVEDGREYEFYRTILEPFALDSPRMYGHVVSEDGLLLAMEYVPHAPVRFSDYDRFLQAARWLAKKDRVVHENFQSIVGCGCLTFDRERPPFIRTIDDCIDILERGAERDISPLLSRAFVHHVAKRKALLDGYARKVFRTGRLTVCHRDFHIRNVLFPVVETGRTYVVDWSSPEIDSVCIDLARLVLTAPPDLRSRLIQVYRLQGDFDEFESVYDTAELLVSLAQFAWGFSAILQGRRGPFSTSELRRVRRLQTAVASGLQLGTE